MICEPENGSGARDSPEISRICDPDNGSGFAICAEFLEYATRKTGSGVHELSGIPKRCNPLGRVIIPTMG